MSHEFRTPLTLMMAPLEELLTNQAMGGDRESDERRRKVIQDAIETVAPAAAAKGVELEAVLDRSGVPVAGDAQRLQQVVWNLLSNAVKFTPRGGRVQIRLQRVDSYVEMVITDTGEGIAPEFLPHIFQRFTQADGTFSRPHSGLGLGLAICRHLVEAHGGIITADSPGKGGGTTIRVELPSDNAARAL